jgi:beta-mannosidase
MEPIPVSTLSLDLTGRWQFKEYPLSVRRMRDLDAAGWHTTCVPSSIFTSLIAAGLISQKEIDTHPEKFAWVSEKPWVFRKTFDAPAELLACDRIDLVFDGLDTIAAVWLNDKLIARTNNMFIPFRFDVTKLLRPQNNSLLVKFDPAVAHAERLMNRYGRLDDTGFSNPARVYIRKAQYQFGWDFCPPLPGCGIWRPVRLEGIEKARIADMYVRTVDCSHRSADIKVALKLDRLTTEKLTCSLTLSGNGPDLKHDLVFDPAEDSQSTLIHVEDPALWWPSGHGPQHLYRLAARLLAGEDVVDTTYRTLGIRTARLVKSPDSTGQKLHFEVNGRRIFGRGANWVPASIFAGAVTTNDYEQL